MWLVGGQNIGLMYLTCTLFCEWNSIFLHLVRGLERVLLFVVR